MNIQVQIKQDGIKALDRDGANSIIYFSGKEMEQPFKFHGLEFSEKKFLGWNDCPLRQFFLYFLFSFSKFTEIYPGRPVAGRPGPGLPAAGRQGLFCKNFRWEFALRPLEDRSPGSGAAGPPGRPAAGQQAPAARQQGDRLPEAAGPRLLHQKFRKKFSVCRNTIHIAHNGLTVHWYCKSVLALQGSINKIWVQNMKTKTTGP